MGSDELRLPTHSVTVDLLRAGGARERVELFVPDADADVAALLEAPTAFMPVRELGPRVALVGKHAIVWVAIPLSTDDDELYDQRHDVRVEIAGGDPIVGCVLYSSPADRPRLADHLNLEVRFLRVWTAEALYLVNKHHVVRVLETA